MYDKYTTAESIFTRTVRFPPVPGYYAAAVVAAFGNTIQNFTGGHHVVAGNSKLCGHCHCCLRGKELFCEYFTHGVVVVGGLVYAKHPADRVFKFKDLTDVEATLIESGFCVAHGLDKLFKVLVTYIISALFISTLFISALAELL